jgi:hypothetical protein
MYAVPADLPIQPFVGQDLNQICLGRFQIQLHFSGAAAQRARRTTFAVSNLQDQAFWHAACPIESEAPMRWTPAKIALHVVIFVVVIVIMSAVSISLGTGPVLFSP